MDKTNLIYWLTVLSNLKSILTFLLIMFTVLTAFAAIDYFFQDDTRKPEKKVKHQKTLIWSLCITVFISFIYIFIPDKKQTMFILIGGKTLDFLSNDTSVQKIPSELSSYFLTEIQNITIDAKEELNIKKEKQRKAEIIENMTPGELLNKLETDSVFRKEYYSN